ncbi:alkylhydroperoxidase [Mycolicibacterium sp. (ex Dasyatis americana)]|uniref:Alkylhydroperoxidase n=1 Tax=Mycobacterium syngnathidarum TaxID=1908205 RepID=A0A1Q9WIE3_9MYCO|nr:MULTISPECIES: carboxymuconolactone decarboxylase family protein [Mycobacterium]MCG7607425.1 carboxymuconolactone decarboxylase family protein [Mycobacterium sp. CnD-18-1]OFB39951.1 alkylhydroperoxidase [Mycolicibacterium sp. (ex Dasyatis americana)]OHU07082.1 alkylhydroperoxidase [Mycobacterium syngnathidarum]OLT98540.1 alkylhydroperoxidase [Mycobacterium syngnathidarum]
MTRLTTPAPEDITAAAQSTLDRVGKQFGFVPNMFEMLASNPAVLEIVTTLQGALGRVLDAKTRHTIALAVSEANGCEYCLAVHSYMSAELGGLSSDDIALARSGGSVDPNRAAVARFAQRLIETRGRVADIDLTAVRGAGYSDSQILAIVAVTVQTLLTNYINNVNQTVIDIPTAAA